MPLSRRALLGTTAAGLAGSALALPTGFGGPGRGPAPRKRGPKNIIFLVVDGMATSVLTMHDHLRQMNGEGASYWATLLARDDVHRGWQDTRSLSSIVTDSSAASSAWGSGRRIWNGQVNIYPDGTALTPITHLMADKGVRCGLVTTATITHATPAGFAVSTLNRDDEALIAEKYLDAGVDVLLGGGDRFFASKSRKDGRDMYAEFAAKGFEVVKDRAALMASRGQKVLGIFSSSHLPFTIDRDNDPKLQTSTPTLAEMASHALENLKGSRNGFLLQIEGARVDHACHGNDAAAALHDQRAFEDALRVAVDFAEKDGDTLVIVTADHACGGISLNGAGEEYADSTKGLRLISGMKSSYTPILAAVAASPTPDRLRAVVNEKLGVDFTPEEAKAVLDALARKSPFALSEFYRTAPSVMGLMLGNHTKIGFTSLNHNSDHVVVTAFGPWSERVVGLQPNVGFYGLMTAAKGIRHSNPVMNYDEAARAMKSMAPPKQAETAHEDEYVLSYSR